MNKVNIILAKNSSIKRNTKEDSHKIITTLLRNLPWYNTLDGNSKISLHKNIEELIDKSKNDISKILGKKTLIQDYCEKLNIHSKVFVEFLLSNYFTGDILSNKENSSIPHVLPQKELKRRLQYIKEMPYREETKQSFPRKYYDRFIKPHDFSRVNDRYTGVDIINELGGALEYDSSIFCASLKIDGKLYGIIWHNKQKNTARASVEDHKQAIEYIKKYEQAWMPIVFWIDTPGAQSWLSANEQHQAKVMSKLITTVSTLTVPSISILSWEGGSGWAEVFMASDKKLTLRVPRW